MSKIENELTYLINPQYQNQIHHSKSKQNKELSNEELKFYRKRIIQSTRDLFDDTYTPPISSSMIRESFLIYAASCINYYKTIDTNDIIQNQYDTLNEVVLSDNTDQYDKNNNEIEFSENNHLLFKQHKTINTIEECMKISRVRHISNPEIFPTKKKVNLRDPSLKIKGVKKKSVSIITSVDDKNEKSDNEDKPNTKKNKK
jgi:hypothetical protein